MLTVAELVDQRRGWIEDMDLLLDRIVDHEIGAYALFLKVVPLMREAGIGAGLGTHGAGIMVAG